MYLCENILSKICAETKTLPYAVHGLRDETTHCNCFQLLFRLLLLLAVAAAAAADDLMLALNQLNEKPKMSGTHVI